MDLLSEVYARLPYEAQIMLSETSRLYAKAFFQLRNDVTFWQKCCRYSNLRVHPEYTATEDEYYYYLSQHILAFISGVVLPKPRVIEDDNSIAQSYTTLKPVYAYPFFSLRVFNECLGQFSVEQDTRNALVYDTISDLIKHNIAPEELLNALNSMFPGGAREYSNTVLLLSLLHSNSTIAKFAIETLDAVVSEINNRYDIQTDERYNINLLFEYSPDTSLRPEMLVRVGYPTTSAITRDYLIRYASTLGDDEVSIVIIAAAAKKNKYLLEVVRLLARSSRVIERLINAAYGSVYSPRMSIDTKTFAALLPAFDPAALSLACKDSRLPRGGSTHAKQIDRLLAPYCT